MSRRVGWTSLFEEGRALRHGLPWRALVPAVVWLLAFGAQPVAGSCEEDVSLRAMAERRDAVVFAGTITAVSDDRSAYEVAVTRWFYPADRAQATMRVSTGSPCSEGVCVEGSHSIGGEVGVAMIFPGTWAGGDALVGVFCPPAELLDNGTSALFEEAVEVFGLPGTDTTERRPPAGQREGLALYLLAAVALGLAAVLLWLKRAPVRQRVD